jgi:hypothetical protein
MNFRYHQIKLLTLNNPPFKGIEGFFCCLEGQNYGTVEVRLKSLGSKKAKTMLAT